MRRTLAVTLLIGSVAGAAFVSETASAAESISAQSVRQAMHFAQKAGRALEAGNVSKAGQLYGRALDRLDGFPDAHLGLGHVAMAERRFDDALDHYERAREGSLDLAELLHHERRRRYDEARNRIADLQQQRAQLVQRIERARSGGRNRQTPNYQALLARLDQSIARLEAIEPPPISSVDEIPAEIDFFVGNALNRSGRFEDAVAAWERAAHGTRKLAPVHVNLAVAYWKLGRLHESREQVRVAEKAGATLNPEFIRELDQALAGASVATAQD